MGGGMESQTRLVTVIESYKAWDRPEEFFATISSDSSLYEADREQLQRIWESACDSQLWKQEDLGACAADANARIAVSFPWLSAFARAQMINGAAYHWR
jgi:hypothetical protein